jgi:hypothetical protein
MLGTEAITAFPKDPTDLTLRRLPAIGPVSGHGRHHPRAGCETLTDAEFAGALSGFILGEIIFEDYGRWTTLKDRYDAIVKGMELAAEEEPRSPGVVRGFAAYIVAVIDGYAAMAQVEAWLSVVTGKPS